MSYLPCRIEKEIIMYHVQSIVTLFLIGSASNLQESRTAINSRMSLNFSNLIIHIWVNIALEC